MLEYENLTFLNNRTCILMGELKACERFYCAFCNSLNIKYIVVDEGDDLRLDPNGTVYIKYSDIEADLEKYFIILCYDTCIGNSVWDDVFYKKGLYFKYDYIDSQYFLMYDRREREDVLRCKEIWIFGAGNNGEHFWNAYHQEYNICGFISNYDSNTQKCGLPVVRLEDLYDKKNVFVVICSVYEMSMYDQLLKMGMQIERDFTFAEFFPKKFFFGIGTCQIYYCVTMLLGNSTFSKRFVCLTFGENREVYASVANRLRMKEYSEFCDVLFYQSADSQAKVSLNYTTVFRFCKNILKISMPYYYFRGVYAQMDIRWRDKINFVNGDFEKFFSNPVVNHCKLDQEIIDMLEKGMSDQQIFSEMLREDYFSKEQIIRQFNFSVNVIRFLDKFSDIKICPFVVNNYKKIPVFTDTEHMGPELQIFIANEIAARLGIDGIDEKDADKMIENFNSWWPHNLYIYPSVAKALELDYWRDDMKYKNIPFVNEKEVDMKDFMWEQIRFVREIYELYRAKDAERQAN